MLTQPLERYIRELRNSASISRCAAVPVEEIADTQDFLLVSYSHKDYKKVYEDLAVMSQAGVKFWYDEGLEPGKNWDEEVKSVLLHPRCIGVIFFMSEELFLSRSVNQEIKMVCDKDAPTKKPYFSVNLTDMSPFQIIRSVMRKDDAVLNEAGLDTERLNDLTRAFSDRQTYLAFSEVNHRNRLIREIRKQFPTTVGLPCSWDRVGSQDVLSRPRYLEALGSGDAIQLRMGIMNVGRDPTWAHYHVRSPFVGRRHLVIECDEKYTWITDLGSVNGTFVNEKPITPGSLVQLKDGDVLSLGTEKKYVFHMGETLVRMIGTQSERTTFIGDLKRNRDQTGAGGPAGKKGS